MTEPNSVALWFTDDYGHTGYDLYDSEASAALAAAGHEHEHGPGTVLGVQFKDGQAVPAAEWAALDEGRRRHAEFKALRNQPLLPEPSCTVRDPFTGAQVEVTRGDPAWLGAPREVDA